jgi:hypothetical protein
LSWHKEVSKKSQDKTNPRLVPASPLRFVGPTHGAYGQAVLFNEHCSFFHVFV